MLFLCAGTTEFVYWKNSFWVDKRVRDKSYNVVDCNVISLTSNCTNGDGECGGGDDGYGDGYYGGGDDGYGDVDHCRREW